MSPIQKRLLIAAMNKRDMAKLIEVASHVLSNKYTHTEAARTWMVARTHSFSIKPTQLDTALEKLIGLGFISLDQAQQFVA